MLDRQPEWTGPARARTTSLRLSIRHVAAGLMTRMVAARLGAGSSRTAISPKKSALLYVRSTTPTAEMWICERVRRRVRFGARAAERRAPSDGRGC
jgi:hypothetical protein